MNKQREILRHILTTNMSNREIGRTLKASHNTVGRYRLILKDLNLDWENIKDDSDKKISELVVTERERLDLKQMPDWEHVHNQMKLPNVTLRLLWEEYRLMCPGNSYSYSQFTHYYRKYIKKIDLSMRQNHKAGERIFVDFAGTTVPYFDAATNTEKKAQIFVAVMGCSNYTFAYAVKSQSIADWIEAHNKMYAYIGGIPEIVVPDNLKAAVIKAGKNLTLNRIYLEQSKYYGIAIVPARVRMPKDKSKAENGVLIVSRYILARLRHRKFFSIEELNQAINDLLWQLNERPFKKLPGCRRSRFEELDKPLLKPYPGKPFEFAQWVSKQKVRQDYHVHIFDHYYSVPYELVGEYIEARVTKNIVEILFSGRRVASHPRNYVVGDHTTVPAHQPKEHRQYSNLTPENLLAWARKIGPASVAAIEYQFSHRPHTALGLKPCASLQRLAKEYGHEKFELACKRAQEIGSLTLTSIKSILRRRIAELCEEHAPVQMRLPLHQNVRGAEYYASQGGSLC